MKLPKVLFLLGFLASFVFPSSIAGNESRTNELIDKLQTSTTQETKVIERRILSYWMDSGSEEINSLLEQSIAYMNRGEFQASLKILNYIVANRPEFAEGWNIRATLHYLMLNYDLSIDDINRTLELNPKHFGALNGLALIYENTGQKIKALEAYEAVFQISPNRFGIRGAIDRLKKELMSNSI